MTSSSYSPIEIFYSYAPEDELMLVQLERHLSPLREQKLIEEWDYRQIPVGEISLDEIDRHLKTASIILLLVSADFLSSRHTEMLQALERRKTGQVSVIPVLLREVGSLGVTPLKGMKVLPSNHKAVTSWGNQDEAFANIFAGIQKVVENLIIKQMNLQQKDTKDTNPPYPFSQSVLDRRWSKRKRMCLFAICSILTSLIFIIVSIFAFHIFSGSSTPFPSYLPGHGSLLINNPLVDNHLGYQWHGITFPNDPGSCQFAGDGYHIQADNNYYPCQEDKIALTNFVFEVNMRPLPESGGGLSFHNNHAGGGYDIDVGPSGQYSISRPDNSFIAHQQMSSFIPKNQISYLVDIEVVGSQISLYVDKTRITTVYDSNKIYSSGYFGLYVNTDGNISQTEVTFTNAKVWNLI